MKECQMEFKHIQNLLIDPPVLCILIVNANFRLESGMSKTAAGGTLFNFHQGHWIIITIQRICCKQDKITDKQHYNCQV